MLHDKMWHDGLDDFPEDQMSLGVCFGGGKGGGGSSGGGGGAPAAQTINQSNLPPYVEPFFTRLLERTEEESNRDYDPFTGQRLQGFGPDTEAAFQSYRDIAASGRPELLGTAQGAIESAAGYDPRQFTDPGVMESYMNPYITNVLDVQKQRLNERFGEQQVARNAQAIEQGAFSNTARRGVMDAIAQREQNQQLNEIEASGLAQAFDVAGQQFDLDRRAQMGAEQLGIGAAGQAAAQAGLEDELAITRAAALSGVGTSIEDKLQAGLDIGYGDFTNQRDFPRQQLNFYSGILRGVPIQANQEITRYQAPASPANQLLGLGLGGLGLYRAMNQ